MKFATTMTAALSQQSTRILSLRPRKITWLADNVNLQLNANIRSRFPHVTRTLKQDKLRLFKSTTTSIIPESTIRSD